MERGTTFRPCGGIRLNTGRWGNRTTNTSAADDGDKKGGTSGIKKKAKRQGILYSWGLTYSKRLAKNLKDGVCKEKVGTPGFQERRSKKGGGGGSGLKITVCGRRGVCPGEKTGDPAARGDLLGMPAWSMGRFFCRRLALKKRGQNSYRC